MRLWIAAMLVLLPNATSTLVAQEPPVLEVQVGQRFFVPITVESVGPRAVKKVSVQFDYLNSLLGYVGLSGSEFGAVTAVPRVDGGVIHLTATWTANPDTVMPIGRLFYVIFEANSATDAVRLPVSNVQVTYADDAEAVVQVTADPDAVIDMPHLVNPWKLAILVRQVLRFMLDLKESIQ